jgi:hypothetical protein
MSLPDPSSDPLLLAAGIASFDMLSGIRVIQSWLFSDTVDPFNLTDLFKIVLSNVHRQSEQSYAEFSISTVEMPTLNWFLVNSIFIIPNAKRQPVYYSAGLIFNLTTIPTAPEFNDILSSWSRIFTIVSKGLLLNSRPLKGLGDLINLISLDISTVSRVSISALPSFEISPNDAILYSRLLTAHFQTQMTIVIESANNMPEHSQQIACFLAHFSLPHQRRFSSLELLPKVSPHLFIQCVQPQGQGAYQDLMLLFDRPITWVQLPDRRDGPVKIYKSDVTFEEHRALQEEFIRTKFVHRETGDEGGLNKRLRDLRESLRIQDLIVPAPWCIVRVALLLETPENSRFLFCAEQLAGIVRTAVSLVAIIQTRGGEMMGGGGDSQEKELKTALRLVGAVDWEMVVALAKLFNKNIANKWNNVRKAMSQPFLNILGPRRA